MEERWEWEEFERADNVGPEGYGHRRSNTPPASSATVRNVKRLVLCAAADGLVDALKPFAAYADAWHDDEPDSTLVEYHDERASITLGDGRAARDASGGINGE